MDWIPEAKDQRITEAEAEVAQMLEVNPEIASIHSQLSFMSALDEFDILVSLKGLLLVRYVHCNTSMDQDSLSIS